MQSHSQSQSIAGLLRLQLHRASQEQDRFLRVLQTHLSQGEGKQGASSVRSPLNIVQKDLPALFISPRLAQEIGQLDGRRREIGVQSQGLSQVSLSLVSLSKSTGHAAQPHPD